MKYLKKFKLFESLNSQILTEEETINLLKEKCKKFLSNPNALDGEVIFRKDEDRGDYLLVNPKQSASSRVSSNVSNFHNLLISNLDSWQNWPKRNKSLVCASYNRAFTHNPSWTRNYAHYVVIPFDTTKVATGDRNDFWICFGKLPNRYAWRDDNSGRPSLPAYLKSLFRDLGYVHSTRELDKETGLWYDKFNELRLDINWNELKSFLESAQMTDALIEKYFKVKSDLVWNNNLNLLENLNILLDPVRNKFKLGDVNSTMKLYSKLDQEANYDRAGLESWMEDECIMIKPQLLHSILMNNL